MKKNEPMNANHQFPAIFDENSEILILGSFPSVASRKINFFYGHPRNRFWQVLSSCLDEDLPLDNQGRKQLCLRHHIALYDSIESCLICGSSDSSIKDVVPANLSFIYTYARVKRIIFNGKAAEKWFYQYQSVPEGVEAICLPSTSPANAAYSLEKLVAEWKCFLK